MCFYVSYIADEGTCAYQTKRELALIYEALQLLWTHEISDIETSEDLGPKGSNSEYQVVETLLYP